MAIQFSNGSMSHMFHILTDYDEETEITDIYIGDPTQYSKACVFMQVDDSDLAILQSAAYRPGCALDGNMKSGTATVLMLQGSLKYLFTNYPHVKSIEINDKTMVPDGKIYITAKRLLQGRKGWYEEHLQADAYGATILLMKELHKSVVLAKIAEYDSVTKSRSWGVQRDIEELAPKISPKLGANVLGTSWRVRKDVALNYQVSIHTYASSTTHGGVVPRQRSIRQSIKRARAKVFKHSLGVLNTYLRINIDK